MKRRVWLVLSIAALFMLREPVCVLACLEESAPVAVVADHADGAAAPCHDSTRTPPARVPASEHVCDCDLLQTVLTKGESGKAGTASQLAASPPLLASFIGVSTAALPAGVWDGERDLPPIDILLRKSTLLI